ncbi:MAG: hypothetical protein HUJ63_10650, partial [Enterococcus sp.]|nr:hypothetical protein [Enterococcus sp.]
DLKAESLYLRLHTKDYDGAGTDSAIQFRLKYCNGDEKTWNAEDYSIKHEASFERDETDYFKLPLNVDDTLSSITVEIREKSSRPDAPWAPDWIEVEGKRIKFTDAYHAGGFWKVTSPSPFWPIWWMKNTGDSATFYLNKENNGKERMDIKTADCPEAGTDNYIMFSVTYADKSTVNIEADDCYIGRSDNKFEQGHVDSFYLPTKVDVPITSITVKISGYNGIGPDWAPETLSFHGKKMWFYSATPNKGRFEDGYWWMGYKDEFATFNV